jgi:hypothetical protein
VKTYGVGLHRIGVYETRDARPHDAVAAVAHESAICFVDRVADLTGMVDASAMTEAVCRHRRLKMAPPDDFQLRFNDPRADSPPSLVGRLHAWRAQRKGGLMSHLGGIQVG